MAGRNSGGDIMDMAATGTTVPEDSAKPRYIPSKPRPGEGLDVTQDPNSFGGVNLADAATNAEDIPRTTKDSAASEIISGIGDALPSQIDSKRLHNVPGGVVHDPNAKGSTRYTQHIKQSSEFTTGASDGPGMDRAPGEENLSDEAVMNKHERKQG